jgi:hypothetical protein
MPATTIPHLQPPEVVKRSVWEDRHERRVNNWITPWDGQERRSTSRSTSTC